MIAQVNGRNYQNADQAAERTAEGLEEVAAIVGDQLGLADAARKLQDRADQVRTDRFKVLVVGEFKRGKSTLLNAMLGDDVMPRKATECTAVVTTIQYGDQPSVTVVFADGSPDEVLCLDEFREKYELTIEDCESRTTAVDRFSRVERAVLSYPVELCRHRIELVDSPGLGAHQTRTLRTQKFLHQVDAVVFVLSALQFLDAEEVHFLESILLPMGLRNIFFIINWYNVLEDSSLREGELERNKRELEEGIRRRLMPFCVINGNDRSNERIFRVNALGALKGRMRRPPSAAMLEESNVPAFEESLQRFLVADRARVRNDVTHSILDTVTDEVKRFIETQETLVSKTIAEIEAESEALQPKLQRLRGIKQHIEGFLDSQSANLQDILTLSFHNHIRRIDENLPEAVEQFDLSEITNRFLTYEALADKFRSDENKLAKKLENVLKPQVTKYLEEELAKWQTSVLRNELKAVAIDVEKHLQEEAAEYQRVLHEIEERLGVQGSTIQIKELVERWLGGGSTSTGNSGFKLDISGGLMGDMGIVIGTIIAEMAIDVATHAAAAATTAWIPVIGWLLAAGRIAWREMNIRKQLNQKIIAGLHDQMYVLENNHLAKIREGIKQDFIGLKQKVTASIEEEIVIIAASLQSILDRKRKGEISAEQEKRRLEAARKALQEAKNRIMPLL